MLMFSTLIFFFGYSLCNGIFQWRLTSEITSAVKFPAYLSQIHDKSDFFYVFTGDTQYWYDCTFDNKNCLIESQCKTTVGTAVQVKECQKKQGEYANRVQQKSIANLNDILINETKHDISGLIINGDLVMFGNEDEINRLKEQWMNYFKFKIYPGLGNHDYSTNINKCTDQDCLNRILIYFKNIVEGNLKLSMDYEIVQYSNKKFINGSLSYSWDECVNSACFHFVQLNYYPFYTKTIDSTTVQWRIQPSMNWLENDLRKHINKPIVLNFHAMDFSLTKSDINEFIQFLNRMVTAKIRSLAIYFAHYHEKFGVKETWCFNNGSVKIPLIYSGSVPANNYILAQFSTRSQTVKNMFQIHAENDLTSLVEKMEFLQPCHAMHNGGRGSRFSRHYTVIIFYAVMLLL